MKRRETTPEEKAFFRAAVDGRKTLVKSSKPKIGAEAKLRPAAKNPPLRPSGIDGRTDERLKRGEIAPDAKIDLHGMTESSAYYALFAFVTAAAKRGNRLVLVVTGKGARPADRYAPFDMGLDERPRGVLNAAALRWLKEPALVRLIADVRAAHRRHGGEGAFYVYLRKRQVK